MNKDNYKKLITEIVSKNPGIKGTQLVTDCINEAYQRGDFHPLHKKFEKDHNPIDLINDMVKSFDLVEVEYILPTMDYRVKSLYFPKDTQVTTIVSGIAPLDVPKDQIPYRSARVEDDPILTEIVNESIQTELKNYGESGFQTAPAYECAMNALGTYIKRSREWNQNTCTCLSELAHDAYGPGGPSSGQPLPPPCVLHSTNK